MKKTARALLEFVIETEMDDDDLHTFLAEMAEEVQQHLKEGETVVAYGMCSFKQMLFNKAVKDARGE